MRDGSPTAPSQTEQRPKATAGAREAVCQSQPGHSTLGLPLVPKLSTPNLYYARLLLRPSFFYLSSPNNPSSIGVRCPSSNYISASSPAVQLPNMLSLRTFASPLPRQCLRTAPRAAFSVRSSTLSQPAPAFALLLRFCCASADHPPGTAANHHVFALQVQRAYSTAGGERVAKYEPTKDSKVCCRLLSPAVNWSSWWSSPPVVTQPTPRLWSHDKITQTPWQPTSRPPDLPI